MDLDTLTRKELQEICRDHSLYAGGNKADLIERLQQALAPGTKVSVYFPAREMWRDGVITRLLYGGKFEVVYDDNFKEAVHQVQDTVFDIIQEASEEEASSEEDDTDSDCVDADIIGSSSLSMFSKEQLRAFLQARGLPAAGPRLQLEAVVRSYLEELDAHSKVEMTVNEVGSWTKKEMQAYCRTHGLPTRGNKGELQEMIVRDILEVGDEESESEQEGVDLSDWTKKELQNFLREHGLYTGGSREELEERVRAEVLGQESEGEESDGSMESLVAGMAHLHTHDRPAYTTPRDLPGLRGPKKRALIVGCSYTGTSGYLPGTLNDAMDIYDLMVSHFSFPNTADCIMLLTEDLGDRFRLPTRHNIIKGFEWLMHDLQPGDSLFFYFSGHGGCEPEPTGEEPSGYNQLICPCDYGSSGDIKDSLIHEKLVAPLPMGVTLHALIDSCHSGTVMNLPYNAVLRDGEFADWEEEYEGKSWKKTTAGGLAVQFSASRHDQYAHERRVRSSRRKSSNNGAATYAFIQAIQRHKDVWGFNIVYGELLKTMADELQADSRFREQEPQLSASTAFDCMSHRTKLKL